MNCIKNECIKIIMYKKLTYKNEIIKNERVKNERLKNELIKKRTDPVQRPLRINTVQYVSYRESKSIYRFFTPSKHY